MEVKRFFFQYSLVCTALLSVTGCLYSENNAHAPVYESRTQQRNMKPVYNEPQVLNSTFTPMPQSIERRSSDAVRVRPLPSPIPSPTARRTVNPIAAKVIRTPMNNSVQKNAPTQNQASQINNAYQTKPGQNSVASFTDKRVKEGSEILNNTAQTLNPNSPGAKPLKTLTEIENNAVKDQKALTNVERPSSSASMQNPTTEITKEPDNKQVEPKKTETKPKKAMSASAALIEEAGIALKAKNFDKAASSLERAHRIEPGNARILFDIAQIRHAQGKFRQAESFASKAATMASSGSSIYKKSWALLSEIRMKLGNSTGAAIAAKKAGIELK